MWTGARSGHGEVYLPSLIALAEGAADILSSLIFPSDILPSLMVPLGVEVCSILSLLASVEPQAAVPVAQVVAAPGWAPRFASPSPAAATAQGRALAVARARVSSPSRAAAYTIAVIPATYPRAE